MPEIQIRPANLADIQHLTAIDHDYSSEVVWQMELQTEEGQVNVSFRQVRLPRSVRVGYPRSPASLVEDWMQRSGLLVAQLEGQVVAYTSLMLNIAPATTWMTDLAVVRRLTTPHLSYNHGDATEELSSSMYGSKTRLRLLWL